jgi:DNA polymerase-4
MHAQGIFTIADILSPRSVICNPQSALCRYLTAVATGEDTQVMQYDRVEKSISRDTTFGHDTSDTKFITSTLYYLTEHCCKTLRKRNQVASTATVKVRFTDFTTVQKQTTLAVATENEEEIFTVAQRMLTVLLRPNHLIRLVGVKVSHLSSSDKAQMQLGVMRSEKISNLHRRLDGLQAKHGYTSIQWGITYALYERYEAGDDGYRLHSPVYGL